MPIGIALIGWTNKKNRIFKDEFISRLISQIEADKVIISNIKKNLGDKDSATKYIAL